MTEDVTDDRFWTGFGLSDMPDVRGLRILEIGCGTGKRCLELAKAGAARVVGLDIIPEDIEKSRKRLEGELGDDAASHEFHLGDLHSLEEDGFDIILSEDTFEHIMDVPEVLEAVRKKLSPGGKVYLGFGPLYYSPFGDHGWFRSALPLGDRFSWPWGHVLVPEPILYKRVSKKVGHHVDGDENWPYLTLNKHTPKEFEHFFATSGLDVEEIKYNPGRSLAGQVMEVAGRIPFMRKYTIWGIYAVLCQRSDAVRI